MDRELEAYFDNYIELFNTEGFKQLVDELKQNTAQLSDIQSVKDSEELFFRKGQVTALTMIINLESTIIAAREQAEAEAEGDLYV